MVAIRGQLDANKPQGQALLPGGIDPRILTAVQDQTLISRQAITTASGTADNSATAAQALGAQDRVNRARIGATPNLRDTPALPAGKQPPPKTWEEVMSPTGLDRANAQRIAEGKPPLKSLRDDPEFMSTARALYAKQGLSPAQIEQKIDEAVKLSEQPMVPMKPPETPRLPPPGFGEGFGDRWRSTEQGIKNLIGQGGPGAPGVVESWKGVNDSLTETLTNPVGVVKDEIDHFKQSPSLAYYLGEKSFDASATAATLPFGGEGAAARAALPTELTTTAGEMGMRSTALDGLPSVGTHPPVSAANPLFHDAADFFGADHHAGDVDAPSGHTDLPELLLPDTGPYPLPDTPLLQTGPNEAHFWSGRGNDGIGVGPLAAGGNGTADLIAGSQGTTLEGLLAQQGIEPPIWTPGDVHAQNWWSAVSQTYAESSSGELTAVLGPNLRPGNVWETVELPRLMDNPNVTKITVINSETGAETVVFQR